MLVRTEEAIENHQLSPEKLFLFNLFGFKFSYDDNKKTCTIEVALHEIMLGPIKFIHGGFIAFLADTCMAHLCTHFLNADFVALELSTQYLKSAQNGVILAEATFKKQGKTIVFTDCVVKTKEGATLASSSATFYVLPKEQGKS